MDPYRSYREYFACIVCCPNPKQCSSENLKNHRGEECDFCGKVYCPSHFRHQCESWLFICSLCSPIGTKPIYYAHHQGFPKGDDWRCNKHCLPLENFFFLEGDKSHLSNYCCVECNRYYPLLSGRQCHLCLVYTCTDHCSSHAH